MDCPKGKILVRFRISIKGMDGYAFPARKSKTPGTIAVGKCNYSLRSIGQEAGSEIAPDTQRPFVPFQGPPELSFVLAASAAAFP
jgi:hypothetical protein